MADITTQILLEIRDEIRATNARLDTTNTQLDATNTRLDRLERQQVEAEVRVSAALVDVVGAIHELRDTLLEDR
jgi:hypothetical protein